MAPPGCSTFYALAPVPHLGKVPVDWDEEGERYAETHPRQVEARLIPDIRSRIRTSFHYAPADFQSRPERASRLRLQPRAGADAERLVPRPQPRRRDPQPLFRRRRHPSRRGHSRRGRKRQGDRRADAVMSEARDRLVEAAGRTIAAGSKSFRFASQMFDLPTRERSWLLYAWCRACDDVTDGQTLGHDAVAPDDPQERIAFLRERPTPRSPARRPGSSPFDALATSPPKRAIPADLPARPPRRLRARRRRLAPRERGGIAVLLLPGRGRGRRDDGACHGRRSPSDRDTLDRAVRPRHRLPARQHRARHRRGRAGRTDLSSRRLARRGGADRRRPRRSRAPPSARPDRPSASPRWPRPTAARARSAPRACPSAAAGRCCRPPESTARSRRARSRSARAPGTGGSAFRKRRSSRW